jgi:hypothetical protein
MSDLQIARGADEPGTQPQPQPEAAPPQPSAAAAAVAAFGTGLNLLNFTGRLGLADQRQPSPRSAPASTCSTSPAGARCR